MDSRPSETKQEKERKKKARAALLTFLQRLRKACKVMDGIDTWQECMQELEALLQHHQADIPAAYLQRLRNAMQPTNATRAGLGKACKVLQWELEQTINILPAAGHLAGGLLGGLAAVAVAIGALAIFLEQTAVEVVVVNDGCSPLAATGMSIDLPGLHVPSEPIPSGGRAVAKVPAISVDVDATQQDRVELVFLGFSVPVEIGQRVRDVRFDGMSVLGQRTSLHLGKQGQHELVVACR